MSKQQFPELPAELAGWRWSASPSGNVTLAHPDGAFVTRLYSKPQRAIEEARRWLLSQPKAPATESPERAFANGVLAEYEAKVAQQAGHAVAAPTFTRPMTMPERLMVDPATLVDGRWQPRTAMDEAALMELLDSIVEHGVLEDLIAVVNERGELELITGHRRAAAARRIPSRPTVPVKVLDGVTVAQATEIAIISNDQRADLTDVERGQAYERIIAEQGISEAELARRLSRPRAYIQQRRAVASASPELVKALSAGELSFTHARAICEGAGGSHAAQKAVVSEALRRIKQGSPVRAEDLRKDAERQVLDTAEGDLKKLGWKVTSTWLNGGRRTYVFAPTAPPAEWSSAEILAAVKQARRPPDAAPEIAQFSKEDLEILGRRGFRVEMGFAPWPAVESADGKRYLFGEEAAAALASARADVAKLVERFAAAGWQARWTGRSTLVATQGTGKQKREESPWNWADAQKLISAIEKGAYTPSKSGRAPFTCPRRKTKSVGGEYRQFGGSYQTVCMDCSTALAAEEAAQQQALAAALEAELGAWLDAAPPAALALIISEAFRVQDLGAPKTWRGRAKEALASTAWRYRADLAQRGVAFAQPAQDTVTAAGETRHAVAPPAEVPALGSLEHQILGAASGARPFTLDTLTGWLDELAARWEAGQAADGDRDTLARLGALLDELQGEDMAEWAVVNARIDELAERLDEMEVRDAA